MWGLFSQELSDARNNTMQILLLSVTENSLLPHRITPYLLLSRFSFRSESLIYSSFCPHCIIWRRKGSFGDVLKKYSPLSTQCKCLEVYCSQYIQQAPKPAVDNGDLLSLLEDRQALTQGWKLFIPLKKDCPSWIINIIMDKNKTEILLFLKE